MLQLHIYPSRSRARQARTSIAVGRKYFRPVWSPCRAEATTERIALTGAGGVFRVLWLLEDDGAAAEEEIHAGVDTDD